MGGGKQVGSRCFKVLYVAAYFVYKIRWLKPQLYGLCCLSEDSFVPRVGDHKVPAVLGSYHEDSTFHKMYFHTKKPQCISFYLFTRF